jgi:hypothetical protein
LSISAAIVVTTTFGLPLKAEAQANAASPSQGAPAMRVYRDPATGELTGPPADEERTTAPDGADGSPPPLVIEPNPAGGVKIRLGEAHEHSLRATKDGSGKTTVDCKRGTAAGRE